MRRLNIVIWLNLLSRFLIGAWLAFKTYDNVLLPETNTAENVIALFLEVMILLVIVYGYKRQKEESVSILCIAQLFVCMSSAIVVITDLDIGDELGFAFIQWLFLFAHCRGYTFYYFTDILRFF